MPALQIGISATVANMRFCKPLDIELVRQLCREHAVVITAEEGAAGGFGAHVQHFMALDGLMDDGKVKFRPMVLPPPAASISACPTRWQRRVWALRSWPTHLWMAMLKQARSLTVK